MAESLSTPQLHQQQQRQDNNEQEVMEQVTKRLDRLEIISDSTASLTDASLESSTPQDNHACNDISSSSENIINIPSGRKSVRFSEIQIREFGITLGDHPGTCMGPPITIEWKHQSEHVVNVDDYEKCFEEDKRRRGRELLMPGRIRQKMLVSTNHSMADICKAQRQAGRVRSNRRVAVATADVEHLEIAIQSAIRKFKRWRKRRSGAEPEPAEAWLLEFKRRQRSRSEPNVQDLQKKDLVDGIEQAGQMRLHSQPPMKLPSF